MLKILAILLLVTQLNANIESDKFQHMFVGFGIYAVCLLTGNILDSLEYTHPLDGATCLVPVFIAGAGKEWYDHGHEGHTAEFADFAYTVAIPVGLSFAIYEW